MKLITSMEQHSKLISYLEQENSVLHEKLRSLEIALEKEREACAKVAEEYAALHANYGASSGKRQTASDAANSIAQLIRQRGEK